MSDRLPGFVATVAAAALLIAALASSPAEAASRDRGGPTAPGNLRVLAVTAYTVTLEWEASRSKYGIESYVICCANNNNEIVSGSTTTHKYTKGLEALRTYTLRVFARDYAGNWSKMSNDVTFTTTADNTPPGKPVVTTTEVAATRIALVWSAPTDEGLLWYTVRMNGNATEFTQTQATSGTFFQLSPSTSYTFTVVATDFVGNVSPVSDPLAVTTTPVPNDTVAPSTPASFWGDGFGDGSGELLLQWSTATGDITPAAYVYYEMYLNGAFLFGVVGRTSQTDPRETGHAQHLRALRHRRGEEPLRARHLRDRPPVRVVFPHGRRQTAPPAPVPARHHLI
jgi:chitodextrinase